MFARQMFAASRVAPAPAAQFGAAAQQTRNAASLKSLKARMRSFENMKKLTKSMKMVAAAKLKHDERRMNIAMPFVKPVQDLFERLPREEKSGPITYFGMTSDKGLCGGVNTAVSKLIRFGLVDEEAKGNSVKYMGIGLKGVAALKRIYGDRFTYTFEECAKVAWTFSAASIIAEKIIAVNPNRLKVSRNKFRTLVSYDTELSNCVTMNEALTMDRAEFSKAMDVYSFEPSIYEVWNDLHEFYYATVIHGSYLEGAVCEQSSRMGAMENASKNANEMLEKVALQYNRARQAKITTELCEIISGASAV
jgi:F-type H+-transporting ATPase subunit gamma